MMFASAPSSWLAHPIVVGTLAFAAVTAVVGYLATAGRRPVIRCFVSAGLFVLTMGAGLQYL
jgi:hypothetical protein